MTKQEIKKKLGGEVSFAPEGLGDYSSNVALVEAKNKGISPMKAGENIIAELKKDKKFALLFSDIKIAKPGFINFYLTDDVLREEVQEILKRREKYGSSSPTLFSKVGLDKAKIGRGQKVNLEF